MMDPVERHLVALASGVYPVLLLPASDAQRWRFGPGIAEMVSSASQQEPFRQAVMTDSVLSRLFPDLDENDRWGFVYQSTASGTRVLLSTFAIALLENAWRGANLTRVTATREDFVQEVQLCLASLRNAVRNKAADAWIVVGISGVRLPEGTSIQLPKGKLRNIDAADVGLLPPLADGTRLGQPVAGTVATFNKGDALLVCKVPYRITIGSIDHASEGWPVDLISGEAAARVIDTVRLALRLSGHEAFGPLVRVEWITFIEPLASGSGWTMQNATSPPSSIRCELTSNDANDVSEWIVRIDAGRKPKIDIAVRRALQAAGERTDASDALIDCVVVWENLVGSSAGESTFRVSSALGWLLGGDNEDERLRYQAATSAMYSLRSGIVHGTTVLDAARAAQTRTDALSLTTQILRVLFRDRPDLLVDCKTSTERNRRLILNVAPSRDAVTKKRP